jgi:uncharacterized RDD family membrane protein YckC
METATILTDLENEISLEPVSPGTRFLNFIIDLIAFYIFLLLIGFLIGAYAVYTNNTSFLDDESSTTTATDYLLSYGTFILYYTLLEGLAKGKSIGKWITGTIAVKEDGHKISLKDAFLRSLCRIVPFEAFSAFGYLPWHDRWTHTMVIKKRAQFIA